MAALAVVVGGSVSFFSEPPRTNHSRRPPARSAQPPTGRSNHSRQPTSPRAQLPGPPPASGPEPRQQHARPPAKGLALVFLQPPRASFSARPGRLPAAPPSAACHARLLALQRPAPNLCILAACSLAAAPQLPHTPARPQLPASLACAAKPLAARPPKRRQATTQAPPLPSPPGRAPSSALPRTSLLDAQHTTHALLQHHAAAPCPTRAAAAPRPRAPTRQASSIASFARLPGRTHQLIFPASQFPSSLRMRASST
nr:uncharacterized protein LOC127328769 [Lolium perenne]